MACLQNYYPAGRVFLLGFTKWVASLTFAYCLRPRERDWGGGGGVHVNMKNHDGKKPQEAASRPFFVVFL